LLVLRFLQQNEVNPKLKTRKLQKERGGERCGLDAQK